MNKLQNTIYLLFLNPVHLPPQHRPPQHLGERPARPLAELPALPRLFLPAAVERTVERRPRTAHPRQLSEQLDDLLDERRESLGHVGERVEQRREQPQSTGSRDASEQGVQQVEGGDAERQALRDCEATADVAQQLDREDLLGEGRLLHELEEEVHRDVHRGDAGDCHGDQGARVALEIGVFLVERSTFMFQWSDKTHANVKCHITTFLKNKNF